MALHRHDHRLRHLFDGPDRVGLIGRHRRLFARTDRLQIVAGAEAPAFALQHDAAQFVDILCDRVDVVAQFDEQRRIAVDAAEAKGGAGMAHKRGRRWVLYAGEPEASKVPPAWHAWLHYTTAEPPKPDAPKPRFEQPHQPNLTGTELAYHPQGSVLSDTPRAKGTGDYEPWRPG